MDRANGDIFCLGSRRTLIEEINQALLSTPMRPVADDENMMALTTTKAQLLALLQNFPNDAEIYLMATKVSVQKAVKAAGPRADDDVYMRIASTNVLRETKGVSLIAFVE
ncbi:hypothetical protein GJ697_12230 [Pseudoduganella sp. FT25W]|uniref:Uncharacterized protein n=1 Tax=Duganella alba TaxID=2666081 RepID=A0A6L5QGI5_9BURK|nr:hypothetical protein [Duganella alba]MRX08608.1 hypothetical protein [Duganella alba]MRX19814.1 hypothetical protein [Duganella alba]